MIVTTAQLFKHAYGRYGTRALEQLATHAQGPQAATIPTNL